MTAHAIHASHCAPRPTGFAAIAQWLGLSRQRRCLASLDARALDDIGLSRRAAEKEALRPFWDVPNHWRT